MALIASKSNVFTDPHSRLELKTCVIYLWIPVLIVWSLNIVFLLLYHRLTQWKSDRSLPKDIIEEPPAVEGEPSESISVVAGHSPRLTASHQRRQTIDTSMPMVPLPSPSPLMIDRSVSVASFAKWPKSADDNVDTLQSSNSRLFQIILIGLLISVIGLLFASNDKVNFDIGTLFGPLRVKNLSATSLCDHLGLVPVGAAIVLLAIDTLINHQTPILILSRIDWNVLLLFFGLFVWLDGLNSTGIPHRIWFALSPKTIPYALASSLLGSFSTYIRSRSPVSSPCCLSSSSFSLAAMSSRTFP